MESSIYSLAISSESQNFDKISSILGVTPLPYRNDWAIEIELEKSEITDPIKYFLSLLENKYSELGHVGISNEDITIWLIYGYESQCNMEFDPETTKALGENGISLCISCYQNGIED